MAKKVISGEIKACIFDAYGTLFDIEAAARRQASQIGDGWPELARIWREKQLQYTWLRSLMGEYIPFWEITGNALDYALEALGLHRQKNLRDILMDLYFALEAYPEVPATLDILQNNGLRLGILSNGSPRMLAGAIAAANLANRFESVISVDEIQIYKPDMKVYQMVCDQFALPKSQICFQSSNAWDAWAAKAFGFRVCWINRQSAPEEKMPWRPDVELADLGQLPKALGLAQHNK